MSIYQDLYNANSQEIGLGGPGLDMFVARFFARSGPVWVGDLGTRK
jgi:hypothetical protein